MALRGTGSLRSGSSLWREHATIPSYQYDGLVRRSRACYDSTVTNPP